jgi:hypothetical protein
MGVEVLCPWMVDAYGDEEDCARPLPHVLDPLNFLTADLSIRPYTVGRLTSVRDGRTGSNQNEET